MKNVGLYLLITLFTIPLNGQSYQDSLRAVEYKNRAFDYLKQGKIDSCNYFKKQAIQIFKDNDDLINWINTYKFIGRGYRDYTKNPDKSLVEFQNAFQENLWRQPQNEAEWKALGWLYVNIGYTYSWTLSRYSDAIKYYEVAKEILSDQLGIADNLVGQYVFRELGNIYTRLGEYSAAEILLTKFKDISIQNGAYSKAAEACSDIGLTYSTRENYQKAIESFEEGLRLPNLESRSIGLLNVNLMKVYKSQDRFQKALQYAWKAKFHFEELLKQENSYLSKVWLSSTIVGIGDIYTQLNEFEKAERYLKEAQKLFKEIYAPHQKRELGPLFGYFGELYNNWNKYDKALAYYEKALKCVLPQFDPKDVLENPNSEHFYAEVTIMDFLGGKAITLANRYKEKKEIEDLEVALECHELIFKVEQLLRRSYHYESSKLFSLEESRIRSEKSIALALELAEITNDKRYKERAFEFAERSKSILLLEAFQKANATSIAGIPKDLMEKEKELQQEIAWAEKAIFNAEGKGESNERIKQLNSELLSLRQNYSSWIYNLERKYPQYYNLKYNFNTSTIVDIQALLKKEHKAMVEFFVGDSTIYTFLISPDQFNILQQPKDFPLEDWVINLRNDIEQFQFSGSNRDKLCSNYTEKAQALYQKLFQPLLDFNLPQQLTIIPSGVLGYLPFDALLTEAPKEACDFKNYPYLLYDHSISFGYSATLQLALSENQLKLNNSFVGFAPEFNGQGNFEALGFNIEGLKAIHPLVNGDLFLGQEATLERFKQMVSKYGIIQLATHAKANTATGDFSFIVFADGQGGYDSLFVKDLYLLDLMAEMVVLSACETAVGKLHNGEGIISLARGFLQSGAQSVLTTLWSINDETNKLLMHEFYAQLNTGKSKDEALQHAKLNQIESADRLYAHPVYWAAFSPMGDMEPMFKQFKYAYLIFGGLFIALLLFIRFKPSKKAYKKPGVVRRIIKKRPWSKVGL